MGQSGNQANPSSVRSARRVILTGSLLGVDFAPIGDAPPPVESGPTPDDPARAATPRVVTRDVSIPPPQHDARPSGDKTAALDALRARYEAESEVARAIEGWTNIVFHDGNPDAPLMFIGEAPGADEDASGVPFVGRAGQKLNEMITAMGLVRERDVYIANVLKVRPPNNRTPTLDESQKDGVFLAEQVRIVRPKVIVTLGRPAAQFILESSEPMGAMRGKWHAYQGIDVMPTYHPAYLLRAYTPENRRKVWSDLVLVMERLGLSK